MPTHHPSVLKVIDRHLQAGERLLWSERRQSVLDGSRLLLLGGGLMLLIWVLLYIDCLGAGGMAASESKYLFIFPGISVVCLLLVGCLAFNHHHTYYALTDRRGLVVEAPPIGRHRVHAAPVCPDMVILLERHRDGTASYTIGVQRVGLLALDVGFVKVRSVHELEKQLALCGVKLPTEFLPAGRREVVLPSRRRLFALILVVLFFPWYMFRELEEDPELHLTFFGERTMATIVSHAYTTRREGGRVPKWVTRYYPVLVFRTANGSPAQATDCTGDPIEPVGAPGEQVGILYDPQRPTLAMRTTIRRFVRPVGLLLLWGGGMGLLIADLRRLYIHRRRGKDRR